MIRPRWTPHVTVAAVAELDGRFLLVEEHTDDGLRLNNPAGHLEPGESVVDAAVREALEETARPFTPDGVLGVYLARGSDAAATTYLRIALRGRVGDPVPGRTLDAGIVRALWLTPDEIRASRARHRSPLVLQVVEDHLAGRCWPLQLLHTDASALLG